jgi:hypothetical protein
MKEGVQDVAPAPFLDARRGWSDTVRPPFVGAREAEPDRADAARLHEPHDPGWLGGD